MARRASSDLYRQRSAAEWYVSLWRFPPRWRGGAAQSVAHRRHLNSAGAGGLLEEHGGLSETHSEAYFLKTPEACGWPGARRAAGENRWGGLQFGGPRVRKFSSHR